MCKCRTELARNGGVFGAKGERQSREVLGFFYGSVVVFRSAVEGGIGRGECS